MKICCTLFTVVVLFCRIVPAAAVAEVRDRASLRLTFDEQKPGSVNTVPVDTAKAGKVVDAVALPQGGSGVASVFVSGSPGGAILLEASRRQVVSVASSEDLVRPDVVTVSGFFASLHPVTDTAFHGLFAKRQSGDNGKANYGVNYQPSGDLLQVYVNDGTGFKVATWRAQETIGSRRRVHLTAVYSNGDAPGADADADTDDVRVQLFVNGAPAVPLSVNVGVIDGSSAWLQDVTLDRCVSDAPLTIGGSFPDGELTELICDEFHVFPEAISEPDASAHFLEVAAAAAPEILQEQSVADTAAQAIPEIAALSQYGLTVGRTNLLAISGRNLAGAALRIGNAGIVVRPLENSADSAARFEVDVPANAVPGRYLVRALTAAGASRPLVISLDALPQHVESTFSDTTPATELPVAVSGVISGAEQKRVYFNGRAGQRIVAEVESRRLGSGLDPVVEIKLQNGTPTAIQGRQPDLAGDARAEVLLPSDGVYMAEVHDLQYQAPAGSAWRLLLGDLPASSLAFPPVVSGASFAVRTVGLRGISEPVTLKPSGNRLIVESGSSLLPIPALRPQTGLEVTEPLEGTFDATPIAAVFTAAPLAPVTVTGRIAADGEVDQVLLTVTPGQALHFSVAARSLSSPLRAAMQVFQGDAQVTASDGDSGATDPALDYTVPEGVTQLQVRIRDFTGRGSPASVYRLQVSRKDRPGFQLRTRTQTLQIPANGSAPLPVTVIRQAPAFRYTGTVRLQVAGISGVTVSPQVIPASDQNQEVLLVVTRSAAVDHAAPIESQSLTIEGRSEGLESNVAAAMEVQLDAISTDLLTFRDDVIEIGRSQAIPATVLLDGVPPVLLRGITTTLPVRILPFSDHPAPWARLELMTTEKLRLLDEKNPAAGYRPAIAAPQYQVFMGTATLFPLQVVVPSDVMEPVVHAVIGVSFVPQPLAGATDSRAWTAPIRLIVDNAVTITPPGEPLKATRAATATVSGTLRRHAQFSDPVSVVLEGLPQGYSAMPCHVTSDQSAFSVTVSIPEQAASGAVPGLALRCQHASGNAISPPAPLSLTIE